MAVTTTSEAVAVIRPDGWGEDLGLVQGTGHFREIIGPGTRAQARSLYHIELGPSSSTRFLRHPGDAVYYVISGSARVSAARTDHPLVAGSMFHVLGGTTYSCASDQGSVLLGGPSPVDYGMTDLTSVVDEEGAGGYAGAVTVHHSDAPGLLVPFISADARLIVWLGSGARTANMNYVVLSPGERNREHVHRYSEDTIHILEGHGTAEDLTNDLRLPLGPGDTVHIRPGVWHAVAADRGERIVSVGGPCPADLDMLAAVGVDVQAIMDGQSQPPA